MTSQLSQRLCLTKNPHLHIQTVIPQHVFQCFFFFFGENMSFNVTFGGHSLVNMWVKSAKAFKTKIIVQRLESFIILFFFFLFYYRTTLFIKN